MLLLWPVSFILYFIPLIIVYSLAREANLQNDFDGWSKIILVLLMILSCNTYIIYKKDSKNIIIFVSIVSFLTLFYSTTIIGPIYYIPKLVVTKVKLGNINNAKLILNTKGCDVLNSYGLNVKKINNTGFCTNVEVINILSRFGNNFYIEAKFTNETVNFTLPKESIISWGITSKEPEVK